jgi:opacity protein-like surface antigen
MNKKNLMALSIAASCMMINAAVADKYYVNSQVGLAIPVGKLSSENLDLENPTKKAYKNTAVFNVAGGKFLTEEIAAELEFSYMRPTFKKSVVDGEYYQTVNHKTKISSYAGFLNTNYYFKNLNIAGVVPYVTAGVGYAHNRTNKIYITTANQYTNITSNPKNSHNFAWQIGAGVMVPVTQSVKLKLSFKYKDLGKVKSHNVLSASGYPNAKLSNNILKGKLRSMNFMSGITVDF